MKFTRTVFLASSAMAALFTTHSALAQSTGTQVLEEEVIVKGTVKRSIGGLAVDQSVTKTRSSVTEDFIAKQAPGSILDSINLLPGVNFTDQDATGSVGGDITLRGYDQQRIAFMLDGMPLNDTGNYAYYPTMNPDSEIYSRVDVNLGTTDVDSPTASAGGGTITYLTRKPDDKFGVEVKGTFGSRDYQREYVRVDTGTFGPWGTSAFITASNLSADQFKGVGSADRKQVNGRIYQPLGNGDFASLAFYYNETRNNAIYNSSLATLNGGNWSEAYAATPSSTLATAISSGAVGYYGYRINPTNNGNIRLQFKKHLTDKLVLTVDPSFQYTLADGGTQVSTLNETNGTISTISTATAYQWGELKGYDANKDGVLSSYNIFSPSVTATRRYTVNSSLIWYLNAHNTLRLAYTYDHGIHRQTGRISFLENNLYIGDVFAQDSSSWLYGKNGEAIQKRNRKSYANLNQLAVTYAGSFLDNRLKVDAGVRLPQFERELNNYCYQISSSTAFCSASPVTVPTTTGTVTQITAKAPSSWTVKYDKALPNLGASYKIADHQTLYTSYAETISAPRTDSLYDRLSLDLQPEISKTIDLGYRYTTPQLSGSVALWKTDFEHRVETAWDEDIGASVATDVGKARMKGINAEIGYTPVEGLDLYASSSYTDTEMLENVYYTATAYNPTKGKQLGKVPRLMNAVSVSYEKGPWDFGVNGKYTGKRYASLANVESAAGYTLWNANIGYDVGKIGPAKDVYLRMNVKNLFNKKYISAISTGNVLYDSGNYYWVGAPITTMFTLDTKF
jgi:iron complex outermembrane recepter protein